MMTITEIPGVRIANNATGEMNEITINLKEHPEAIQPLKELGLIPKTQFEIDFENGIPLEQSRKNTMAFIDKLWQK